MNYILQLEFISFCVPRSKLRRTLFEWQGTSSFRRYHSHKRRKFLKWFSFTVKLFRRRKKQNFPLHNWYLFKTAHELAKTKLSLRAPRNKPIGAYIALPASFFQCPMKNGVLSSFTRSHISSDRVRSGYEITKYHSLGRKYRYFVTFFVLYTQSVTLSPRFIPKSVFYTQSVMLSRRFIPKSMFYTQSVVRIPLPAVHVLYWPISEPSVSEISNQPTAFWARSSIVIG